MTALGRVAGPARWLRRFHAPRPAGPLLICFPHAGGSANAYFSLSAALSGTAEVLVVQYPGRQDRFGEPALTDLREMADRIVAALDGLDRRPALFGHSMGSVLAYEVALRLERPGAGPTPVGLIASGRAAPSVRQDWGVRRMGDSAIAAKLADLAGTTAEVLAEPELLAAVIPAVRSDFTAVETYQDGGTTVGCPISGYCGTMDPHVRRDDFLRWAGHTTSTFTAQYFDGGHFFVQAREPQVVQAISRDLVAFTGQAAAPAR